MRTLVLILAIANALFFGWSRGWLDGVTGVPADGGHEPQRMARQVNPERVSLLGQEARAALQKTSCLVLGPLADAEALRAAQTALVKAGVPANAFAPRQEAMAPVWAVATIRLGTKDFQARKEDTYKKLGIRYEYLQGHPEEDPTLVLSRHDSERAAQAALAQLEARALKGLRVLPLQATGQRSELVFAQADGLLQARLRNLRDTDLAAKVRDCSPSTSNPAPGSAGATAQQPPSSGPAAKAG
ncbi:MAG: hypothetical protein JO006_02210 [Paucibacter sp.]|nr:hypothetical protein [Roseateles sp.]